MQIPLTKDGLNANHHQDKDTIILHDRVNQAYRGELGEDFRVKTKKRIDWIVSHVTGKKVLDVGCSQGIVPILLARKGIKVTGVDIDQEVINDAIDDIKNEPKTKANVAFICADFLKHNFGNKDKYDSVVLTEVLEHLYDPEQFIARAFELTKAGGGIVITVPFGVNDHPDHRQNFYLLELYGLVSQYYDLSEVQIIEKWIGFVGKRKKVKGRRQLPSQDLLQLAEEAFYRIERNLTTSNHELFERVSELNEIEAELQRVRAYTSQLWRRADKLERANQRMSSSAALKVGKAVTYIPVRLYAQRHINKIVNEAYLAVFPDKKRIVEGADLRYGELSKPSKQNKFYLKRSVDKTNPLRIVAIMDDFTYSSFKHDAEITQLTPEDWKNEIQIANPDLLFVESAWRGADHLWTNKIAKVPDELKAIVEHCRENSIPTVFWNKEDPVHLAHFMKAASLFDFVFTTDSDSVPIYRSVLGHSRVYMLPFAAQPVFNNPIEEYKRKDKFNFAGSYYRDYKERCRNFDAIMEAALQFRGVDIYDRNYDKDVADKFRYPERYQKYIKGSLPYSEIGKAYKGYTFAITMNTIKHSSTMFARRAFELVASNTATVGNYSKAVKYFLGDLTIASDDKDEITKQLKLITTSDLNERKYRLLGLRRVLSQHTYEERLQRIMSKVFADYKPAVSNDKVSVIVVASTQSDIDQAVDNYNRQEHTNKELIITFNKSGLKIPKIAKVVDSKNRQRVSELVNGDYVAVFSPDVFYGKHYLTDLVLATKYSNADVIGKSAYFTRDKKSNALSIANVDTQYKQGAPIAITKSLIRKLYIGSMPLVKFTKDIAADKMYKSKALTQSIDAFNLLDSDRVTAAQVADVEGAMDINQGESIKEIYRQADAISEHQQSAIKAKVAKKLKLHKTHKIKDNPKEV